MLRGEEWLYLGEADSVFAGLLSYFERHNDSTELPMAFTFETCGPEKRTARLVQLVFKCHPKHTNRAELVAREI